MKESKELEKEGKWRVKEERGDGMAEAGVDEAKKQMNK